MNKIKLIIERLIIFLFLTLAFCMGMFVCYLIYIIPEYIQIVNERANEILPTFAKGTSTLLMICGSFLYLFLSISIVQSPKTSKYGNNDN